MKEKIVEVLTRIYGSVENAMQAICSKRTYVIAALMYLAISELDPIKFCGLCLVAVVYIWSEVKRKEIGKTDSGEGT